jgi:hypothetical protein
VLFLFAVELGQVEKASELEEAAGHHEIALSFR